MKKRDIILVYLMCLDTLGLAILLLGLATLTIYWPIFLVDGLIIIVNLGMFNCLKYMKS
jgi:hypothetical protein